METRYSLYKNGFVKEDLTEIDPIRINSFYSFYEAELFLMRDIANCKKSDYHCLKERKTKFGWESVEDSEHYFVDDEVVECMASKYVDFTRSGDFNNYIHKGFKVKGGNVLYWEMIWHSSGHFTAYSKENGSKRWLNGDTIIEIHFK